MKVTLHRFGRNRRLVLILEWLTLWPTWGPLAVSSQRRDIFKNPLPSPGCSARFTGQNRGSNQVHPGSGGRIGGKARGVKVLGLSPVLQARKPAANQGFALVGAGSKLHINGAIPGTSWPSRASRCQRSSIALAREGRLCSEYALFAGCFCFNDIPHARNAGPSPSGHFRHDFTPAHRRAKVAV